jgi:GntR family transcriptional regulator
LPNEADLAREYGVSTGTVRKALDIMEVEKFVSRHQGRGTIVNDPASGELAVRFSNIRDATGQRIAGVAKTAEAKLSKASKLEIERLQLQPNDEVYRIRRFRYHMDRLYMVEDASLPAALFPGLPEKLASSYRLVVLAQRYGMLIVRAEERVHAAKAEPPVTDQLGLSAGAPVLKLDRVTYALDGRPVEWRVAYVNAVEVHYAAEMT